MLKFWNVPTQVEAALRNSALPRYAKQIAQLAEPSRPAFAFEEDKSGQYATMALYYAIKNRAWSVTYEPGD